MAGNNKAAWVAMKTFLKAMGGVTDAVIGEPKSKMQSGLVAILPESGHIDEVTLQSPRELAVLVDAYLVKGDDTGLRNMIDKLATDYPVASGPIYAQLIYKLEIAKKTDLKAALMAAATAIDPTTPAEFDTLMKQPGAPPTPTPAPAAAATSTYKGPRR